MGGAAAGHNHAVFVGAYVRAHRWEISVSQIREPGFDRALALVLSIGAYSGFFVMAAGVVVHLLIDGPLGAQLELAGVLILLVTPVVRVFVAMGGNFLSATPDTEFTAAALRKCALTAQVSTKLNRAHLVTGRTGGHCHLFARTIIDMLIQREEAENNIR